MEEYDKLTISYEEVIKKLEENISLLKKIVDLKNEKIAILEKMLKL